MTTRLTNWLLGGPYRHALVIPAEGKIMVRLQTIGSFKLDPKTWPIEFATGRIRQDVIDCIGYGETLEAALDEAFGRLPG